ncbi:phosphonate C-P lyase system protein PhnH [Halocynthiibacter styelae]|uniref:Phosphonate C-P lyase system protein PhnH n=1 Tax=Halocynthiibacter styelae TaxID=2761955 RepID=A0A8J7LPF3_9RHOB|nr:phosphonate C-P lyase system protein PhnH [Paenihalocynthiibacter styelae]MBI1493496.1 phosphonate C-P lyase system protein PhnH [Paenihalocynthiibacter styelae]
MRDAMIFEGGFSDVSRDSARAFRSAMNAMAHPGRKFDLTGAKPPAPLSEAAAGLLLVLADANTPVFLTGEHDTDLIRGWITFHTGTALATTPDQASFALGTWDALLPLRQWPAGSAEYPDRSATLIIEHPGEGETARLSGPGIQTHQDCALPAITPFRDNAAQFPLGLDFYFCQGSTVRALPRSTKVEAI